MRLGTGLFIAALCAAPMIASAGEFVERNTFEIRPETIVTNTVNVPEPGSLALLLAGVGGIVATRRRRRDRNDR